MIHKKEVQHIAKLARLGLTEAEIKNFQKELSSILDYFNLLKKVALKQPFLTPKKKDLSENTTREDLAKKQSPKTVSKLFGAASRKEKGCIRVKAVL